MKFQFDPGPTTSLSQICRTGTSCVGLNSEMKKKTNNKILFGRARKNKIKANSHRHQLGKFTTYFAAHLPPLFVTVFVVGKLVLDPFVNLLECHLLVGFTADGHLNQVHVGVRRSFALPTFFAYL